LWRAVGGDAGGLDEALVSAARQDATEAAAAWRTARSSAVVMPRFGRGGGIQLRRAPARMGGERGRQVGLVEIEGDVDPRDAE
jgi:hypothetical protein